MSHGDVRLARGELNEVIVDLGSVVDSLERIEFVGIARVLNLCRSVLGVLVTAGHNGFKPPCPEAEGQPLGAPGEAAPGGVGAEPPHEMDFGDMVDLYCAVRNAHLVLAQKEVMSICKLADVVAAHLEQHMVALEGEVARLARTGEDYRPQTAWRGPRKDGGQ